MAAISSDPRSLQQRLLVRSWVHRPELIAYARRLLAPNSEAAEDVVQEAYLRLIGLAAEGRAPDNPRPWLFQVVRNLTVDEQRRSARESRAVTGNRRAALWAVPASTGPSELLERSEEAREVLREFSSLPPAERRALGLDQAGVPAALIAAATGTTTNAVHQALFRARRRLRKARGTVGALMPVPLVRMILDAVTEPAGSGMAPGGPVVPLGRLVPIAVGSLIAGAAGTGTLIHDLPAHLMHHPTHPASERVVHRRSRTVVRAATIVIPARTATRDTQSRGGGGGTTASQHGARHAHRDRGGSVRPVRSTARVATPVRRAVPREPVARQAPIAPPAGVASRGGVALPAPPPPAALPGVVAPSSASGPVGDDEEGAPRTQARAVEAPAPSDDKSADGAWRHSGRASDGPAADEQRSAPGMRSDSQANDGARSDEGGANHSGSERAPAADQSATAAPRDGDQARVGLDGGGGEHAVDGQDGPGADQVEATEEPAAEQEQAVP